MIKVVEKYTGQILEKNGTDINLYFAPKDCIIVSAEKWIWRQVIMTKKSKISETID